MPRKATPITKKPAAPKKKPVVPEDVKKSFWSIFRDSNSWNEKSIVGFLAFAVMILFAITDLITGIFDVHLAISDTIYNSLIIVTLGAFGIDGIQAFSGKRKDEQY